MAELSKSPDLDKLANPGPESQTAFYTTEDLIGSWSSSDGTKAPGPPTAPEPRLSDTNQHRSRSLRAPRMGISLPVSIHFQGGTKEETQTVFVMDRGAIISLTAAVQLGQRVILKNSKGGKEAECCVTSTERGLKGTNQVELEFTQPMPDFWPVHFPSDDRANEQRNHARNDLASRPVQPQTASSPQPNSRPGNISTTAKELKQEEPHYTGNPASLVPLGASLRAERPAEASTSLSNTGNSIADRIKSIPPLSSRTLPTLELPSIPATRKTPPPAATPYRPPVRRPQTNSQSRSMIIPVASVFALAALVAVGVVVFKHRSQAVAGNSQVAQAPTVTQTPPLQNTTPEPSPQAPKTVEAIKTAAPAPTISQPEISVQPEKIVKEPEPQPAAEPARTRRSSAAAEKPASAVVEKTVPEKRVISTTRTSVGNLIVRKDAPGEEPPPPAPTLTDAASVNRNASASSVLSGVITGGSPNVAAAAPLVVSRVKAARLISSTPPTYPAIARQNRIQGDVTIELSIDPAGKVTQAKVISGPPFLQQAARDSVRNWKFEPASLNDKPIEYQMQVKVHFAIQ
jgi:periplasmic protein TonB